MMVSHDRYNRVWKLDGREKVRSDRGVALLEVLSGFDDDFVAALEAGRDDPLPVQEREAL